MLWAPHLPSDSFQKPAALAPALWLPTAPPSHRSASWGPLPSEHSASLPNADLITTVSHTKSEGSFSLVKNFKKKLSKINASLIG